MANSPTQSPRAPRARGNKRIDLRAALAHAPDALPSVDITFAELANSYVAAHLNGGELMLRKWIDLLGHQSAWTVDPNDLARAGVAMIDQGYSPSTVNRNLSQIGSLYRWAKRRMLTPPGFVSPTLSQYRYDEPIRRVCLSEAEVARLLAAAIAASDRRFSVLIHLLVETGARHGEIIQLRWKNINLDTCTIELLHTKTNQPRVLFFTPQTAQLIQRVWPQRKSEAMLFESDRAPGAALNYKKRWDALRSSIGRPDLRLHDLRHYRAKQLIESGSTLAVAAQALGHSSLILHRRYGHLEKDAIEQAVRASWGM